MADNKKGDTELRVDALVMEIFKNFNKEFNIDDLENSNADDFPILTKDEIKTYIQDIMV